MKRGWVLGALMCGLGVPLSAQAQAMPELPADVAGEFQAVGRLKADRFSTQQGCTATLIAPDLVVTAAHCAARSGQSDRVFFAGWLRGNYVAAPGTLLEQRHPAYAVNGTHSPRNDIALIALDAPIDAVPPIPLGDPDLVVSDGSQVALLGYHRQTPDALSGDFACPAERFQDGLLRIGCQVIGGNSGGPALLQLQDGTWRIIGVVSSRIENDALVVVVPDWLRRQVAQHVSGTQN